MLQDSAISDPHTERKIFVVRLLVAAVFSIDVIFTDDIPLF